MAGDKKVAILPIVGCAASLVAALMFLLPLMVMKAPLTGSESTNLFDMLELFFEGVEGTTLQTITTIVLYVAHLVAIASTIVFGICIFTGNEKLLNIAKIMAYVLAGLTVVGLILSFVLAGDTAEDLKAFMPTVEVGVGVGPILAAVFAIGSAVCSFVLKK